MKKVMKQSTFSKVFSVCSIILIILTVVAIIFNIFANSEISKAYEERISLIENANLLKNTSGYLTNEVRSYATTGDTLYYDNYFNEVENLKNRETAVSNLEQIGITDEEKNIIYEIFSTSNNLVPLEEMAMELVKQDKSKEAIDILFSNEYVEGVNNVTNLNENFNNQIRERTHQNVVYKESIVVFTNIMIFAIFFILSVFQIINNLYFRKNVVSRILKIDDEMNYIAKGEFSSNFNLEPDTSEIGNLINSIITSKKFLKEIINDTAGMCGELALGNFDIETKVDYIGEFAEIKESMEIFIKKVSDMLYNINSVADQVAGGAEQLSDGAQLLSVGSVGQADSISKLAYSINDINQQINKNTQKTNNIKEIADNVREEVNLSNGKMNELIRAIDEINESSLEVSKIIKAIEDVAFQTDILALNAAVEAARAGEAGKGFAVVADEVRNLAVKSSNASKNTSELIEKTINLIQDGNKAASNTISSLSKVFELTKSVIDMIDEIAIATEDEAIAVNEVNDGVNKISEIIQQSSATAEESAATSQQLSAQAQTLKSEVHYFKTKKTVTA